MTEKSFPLILDHWTFWSVLSTQCYCGVCEALRVTRRHIMAFSGISAYRMTVSICVHAGAMGSHFSSFARVKVHSSLPYHHAGTAAISCGLPNITLIPHAPPLSFISEGQLGWDHSLPLPSQRLLRRSQIPDRDYFPFHSLYTIAPFYGKISLNWSRLDLGFFKSKSIG